MIRSSFCLTLLTVMIFAGCAGGGSEKEPIKPKQSVTYKTILEAATADQYEDGCVSCHKKTDKVDQSLPAYVSRIPGHPRVKEATVNECYRCHEAEQNYSLYKKFYRGVHKAHWESETFYTEQNGRCHSCHTVENNGVSGIKKYPLAGYRAGIEKKAPGTPERQTRQHPEVKAEETPKSGKQQEQDTQQSEQQKANEKNSEEKNTSEKNANQNERVEKPGL